MVNDKPREPVRSTGRVAWILVALALVTPVLLSAIGVIGSGKAGYLFVQYGFGWLIGAVLVDLLLRSRSAQAKANGRVVVAAGTFAMAVVAGASLYYDEHRIGEAKSQLVEDFMKTTVDAARVEQTPRAKSTAVDVTPPSSISPPVPVVAEASAHRSTTDKMVAYLAGVKESAKGLALENATLERKFANLDLGAVMSAERLSSAEGIQRSRAEVARMQALVREREAIQQRYFSDVESKIKAAGFDESDLRDVSQGFAEGKANTQKLYADLGAAQARSLKAVSDLLDFVYGLQGRTSVQNGQLMFQTQPELDEYQRRFGKLQEAAAAEDVVSKRTLQQVQKNKQAVADEYRK
jgi:hypothetical protein